MQCEVASQRLPEDRGVDSVGGVFEKAAGKRKNNGLRSPRVFLPNQNKEPRVPLSAVSLAALSLSLLACRQYCVTQIATRPGRISSQEDFLPSQLEHLHIAQFKGGHVFGCVCDAVVVVMRPCVEFLHTAHFHLLSSPFFFLHSSQLVTLVELCRHCGLCSCFTPLTRTLWTTCSSTQRH